MLVKALFLDRDGTIIHDSSESIVALDQVRLIDRADDALALAKRAGFKLIMISNQGGIAKGVVTKERVDEINALLQSILATKNASLDLLYYAPYHPKYPKPEYDAFKSWRKPETGMIRQAQRDLAAQGLEIDFANSFFIGDKQIDVECGLRAGLRSILVKTGYGEEEICKEKHTLPELVANDLCDAIDYVLKINRANVVRHA
ncbi:MAG: HAD-IIIA family hydrolase [Chloroherpetonaceae bacterium]|nr:HAD-IIIA family hydrolase [Chloroherpetonaceae bacterium]MDW8436506.1 HAD-IIIA family hydrolase [Chloroherpetonaceae bacterium]